MKVTNIRPTVVLRGCFAALLALTACNYASAADVQQAPSASSANPAPHKPRILVLATGGTIASTADPRSAIGYNAGGITGEQLLASVPSIGKLASIKAEQLSNVGSQDMNNKIWYQLVRRIKQAIDRDEADGIVITHGTDTMEETAFFLDNVLSTSKPVVLVGSMRPSDANGADGPSNLYEAVEVAASPQSVNRGVLIVMNDTIQDPRWATKTNTTAVQTFLSPNAGPLGYVDSASIRYLSPAPAGPKKALNLPSEGLPRVDIVYAHSDMDATQIDDAVRDNAKGIILAGVGDGNASKVALDAMEAAVRKGIVVVRSTRASSGFVNRNVEVSDDKNGFVASYDLNPQKSRVLAQLLIGNGVTSSGKVQEAFSATY
ncbi:asparaginase [Burkholderia sp. JKS000303]|uniref:asparaginase n=1 Tax=Burkholderia sp. JKS000303 TaxID=1938747 RepID=UPI000BF3D769|nr:asparaginase [Burkholderia sp. JKS000303]PFH20187.1 asparaginase [Burkholderia sp. JKS000303]